MVVVKLRSVVGISMIWLTAVAGVSVTAWVAIDRAGRDITDGPVSSLSPLTVGTAPVVTPPRSAATSTEPTTEPTTKLPAKAKISKTPVPSPPPKSSTAPKPSSPVSVPSASSTPPQDGTFSATGGQVSVRCTGKRIQLRIAQPDDGWRVEVGNAGPDQVSVIFRRGQDEGEGETKVTAVCLGGTPVFRVESHTQSQS